MNAARVLLAKTISYFSRGIVQPTPVPENKTSRVNDKTNPRHGVSEFAVLNFGIENNEIVSSQKDRFFKFNNIELIDCSELDKDQALEVLGKIDETGGLPDKAKILVLDISLKEEDAINSKIQKLIDKHDLIKALDLRYSDKTTSTP